MNKKVGLSRLEEILQWCQAEKGLQSEVVLQCNSR